MPRPIMKAVPVTGAPMAPCFHQAPRLPSGRAEESVGRRSQRKAARRGRGHQLPAGFGFDGQRLFGEDMLAGGERLHRDVEMRGGNRQVQDQIDVGVGDERIDVHRAQAELRGAARSRLRVDIGAGGDLDAAEEGGIAQIGHRNTAASDDADPAVFVMRPNLIPHAFTEPLSQRPRRSLILRSTGYRRTA